MNRKRAFTWLILGLNVALALVLVAGIEFYLARRTHAPLQNWGWRDPFNRPHEQNQLGFRGQPIAYTEKDFVVVLLGDSFVQADACPFDMMPERRLQYHLGRLTQRPVRVFSVAAGGYGQDQELFALAEYFRTYRADLVVLWETPANDVWNNMFPTHWPKDGWPKPTFWLDDREQLQGPHAEWGAPLYGRFRVVAKIRRSLSSSLDEFWEKTYLPAPYPPVPHGQPVIDTAGWKLDPREDFLHEKTHFVLNFSPVSERTRYGIALTNRLLGRIQATAEENHAQFVAFLPNPDNLPPDGFYPVTVEGHRSAFVRFDQGQYWQNIQEVNRSLPFFMVPVTVRPFRVSETDGHLNYPAVDQVMRDLAATLHPLVDGRARALEVTAAGVPRYEADDTLPVDNVNLVTADIFGLAGFRFLEGPYPDWGIPHQVRWMSEWKAGILFQYPGGRDLKRVLTVKARTAAMPQWLTVYANGKQVLSASFPKADAWSTWTSEPFQVLPGDNHLTLEAVNAIRPNPGGPPLYILFEDIRLENESPESRVD